MAMGRVGPLVDRPRTLRLHLVSNSRLSIDQGRSIQHIHGNSKTRLRGRPAYILEPDRASRWNDPFIQSDIGKSNLHFCSESLDRSVSISRNLHPDCDWCRRRQDALCNRDLEHRYCQDREFSLIISQPDNPESRRTCVTEWSTLSSVVRED